jgi:hypothetical protein
VATESEEVWSLQGLEGWDKTAKYGGQEEEDNKPSKGKGKDKDKVDQEGEGVHNWMPMF